MNAALTVALPPEDGADPLRAAADRAARDKDRVVLTRDGKPVAALVPIEDLEALEAAEDAEDEAVAVERLAAWEAAGQPKGTPLKEIAAELGITLSADDPAS
ncbi:MAG: type II toxin-antitoxin system prevent-host-death family antitoxin [Rhodospirillales bacterium]|nr:type II toxin-antitoxin system prevent-host-death family antitoxin [Rhodospirillales bacterium]